MFKESSGFITAVKNFFTSNNNLLFLQFTESDINKIELVMSLISKQVTNNSSNPSYKEKSVVIVIHLAS